MVEQTNGVDLVAFLTARIGEDEEVARKAKRMGTCFYTWPLWTVSDHHAYGHELGPRGSVEASPGRVLDEVDAKRQIMHEVLWVTDGQANLDVDCGQTRVLRALALPYNDHPDYRQEWRT
jgi:hypothetical protein